MNRQPKGIPAGGQFATNSHDEADVSLSDDEAVVAQTMQVAGRSYDIEKTGDGEYRIMQNVGDSRVEVTTFESASEYEDSIDDEARIALAEARGNNIDSAERLELGVGTVTIRLDAGDDSDRIAETLHEIAGQIENGNTSGFDPTWSVGEDKDEDVAGSHTLSISLDGNRAQYTLEEVARSVEDGNTSGYYPNFDIERGDNIEDEYAESIAGMVNYGEVVQIDGADDDERFVVIRDPSLPNVYVINVSKGGETQSATIDKRVFDENMLDAVDNADWETGYEI